MSGALLPDKKCTGGQRPPRELSLLNTDNRLNCLKAVRAGFGVQSSGVKFLAGLGSLDWWVRLDLGGLGLVWFWASGLSGLLSGEFCHDTYRKRGSYPQH